MNRLYGEIDDFEGQVRNGTILAKFCLTINQDEQRKRFEEHAPSRFNLTDEDWRNREKWPLYHRAACDMIERISASTAPWSLVEANSKHFARLKVLAHGHRPFG